MGGAPITHGEIPPPAVQKQDTPCPVSRFLESDPPSATAPPRASPPRPPMSSGPCHDSPSGTQLWQGQRPDLIPAWANGPGHRAPTVKGQRPDPDLWANFGRTLAGLDRAFSPPFFLVTCSWAAGPGWYGSRRWRFGGSAAFTSGGNGSNVPATTGRTTVKMKPTNHKTAKLRLT